MLNIKKVRTEHAISKYEVCKKAGIDFHTLAKIENGGDVKLSTLHKIAEALGVDVVDLFERSTIMAKYNCSTMGKYMMMLKEDIKEALQGKVEGEAASKEECDRVILNTFDAAVYHVQELATGSRALNRIMENHGCKLDAELLQEYIVTYEEEKHKYNDYKYEGEENDD